MTFPVFSSPMSYGYSPIIVKDEELSALSEAPEPLFSDVQQENVPVLDMTSVQEEVELGVEEDEVKQAYELFMSPSRHAVMEELEVKEQEEEDEEEESEEEEDSDESEEEEEEQEDEEEEEEEAQRVVIEEKSEPLEKKVI